MTFILTINTDSAAFDDDYRNKEITRILRAAADQIHFRSFDTTEILRDINGNVCGEFAIRHDEG